MQTKRDSLIRLTLITMAVAAAILVFRGSLTRLIVEPIAWLLWAGWRLVASVDRSICWLLLIVVCAVLVIRLASTRLGTYREERAVHEPESAFRDRIDHWQAVERRAARGREGRAAFRTSLEILALSVANATKTRPPQHLMQQNPSDSEAQPAAPRPAKAVLRELLAAGLAGLLPGYGRRADLNAIEGLLDWMESALEIRHD